MCFRLLIETDMNKLIFGNRMWYHVLLDLENWLLINYLYNNILVY